MYKQRHYSVSDTASIIAFMQQNPFAILCGVNKHNAPVATQIPVLVEAKGAQISITGHIMKKTDHYEALQSNTAVLLIFNGPHSYISASWYPDPKVASTWNYLAVQAKGTVQLLNNDALRDILQRTTRLFEHQESPALMEHMSEAYIEANLKAIAAFEVTVEHLDATFKLSQNKDKQTRENIINKLSHSEDPQARQIAEEMLKRLDEK